MRLILSAGIIDIASIDKDISNNETAMSSLVDAAVLLCRMGWQPTLTELDSLLPCERAALLTARERLEGESAARSALANSGPLGMALASGDDEARVDVALAAGLAGAVRKARNLEPS